MHWKDLLDCGVVTTDVAKTSGCCKSSGVDNFVKAFNCDVPSKSSDVPVGSSDVSGTSVIGDASGCIVVVNC